MFSLRASVLFWMATAAWLGFFADAVIFTASQAMETARQLIALSSEDAARIRGLGRAGLSALQVHRAFLEHPIATSGWLVEKTGITPATVNKCLSHLERLLFHRNIATLLIEWKNKRGRKPLVIRGSRQVGKTSAVH